VAAAVAVCASTTRPLEAAQVELAEAAVERPAASAALSPSAAAVAAVDSKLSHDWSVSCLEAEVEVAEAVDPYCQQAATQFEPVVWETAALD